MDLADFHSFGERMFRLAEIYSRAISPRLCEDYFNSLRDLSLSQLDFAISSHLKDPKKCSFFPKPGELLAFCNISPKKIEDVSPCEKCKNAKFDMHLPFDSGKSMKICEKCYLCFFWEPINLAQLLSMGQQVVNSYFARPYRKMDESGNRIPPK
jgi:hypothetical protein